MGLLGDVYSYGDTLKRKVGGLLSDPRGTLEQFVGQLGDDTNAQINNMLVGYGMFGNKSVLADPKQVQAAQKALADYGAQSGMSAATVWHGSPHKFDKFDSSKIGTGEGAQAYGDGLYLAESDKVAKSYQTALSAERGFSFGGKTGLTRAQVEDMANAKYGDVYLDGVIRPSGVAGSFIDDMVTGVSRPPGFYPRQYKPGSERAKLYDELRGQVTHADPGFLYKVDLPDEHIAKMLDWDKPLSQQHPDVQSALTKIGVKIEQTNPPASREAIEAAKEAFRLDPSRANFQAMGKLMNDGQTGMGSSLIKGNVLKGFTNSNGMVVRPEELLKQHGIPGIRYLDGGSRGAGAGTSNFVVFPGNEGMLQILERNNKALDIFKDTTWEPPLFPDTTR